VPFFAGTGHHVVLVSHQKPVLEGIAVAARKVFRVDATAIACDLTEPNGAHALFAELSQRKINVDVLVNNAGFGAYGEFAASELETEERIIQANIVALTVLTKLLLPGMVARGGGRILNVASTAGFAAIPLHSVYSAAQAYVLGFSEALSEELKGTGVTVTSLSPDPLQTEFAESVKFENAQSEQKQTMFARFVARTGFRALLRGDRVAAPGWGNLAMASPIG
jgi:short-subunit dehydrogenase